MRRPKQDRIFLATPGGVKAWEAKCGLMAYEAAAKLGVPLRTYMRYKAEGLPKKLQREVILDRMEVASPKRGQ